MDGKKVNEISQAVIDKYEGELPSNKLNGF
jgi:hypothetical protein